MWRHATCAALFAVAGATAAAQPRVFSNVCSEPESGDVDGYVVTVDTGPSATRIQFQWAEGALMQAVPGEPTFDPKSRRLVFIARTPAGMFRFDGRLSLKALAGSLRTPFARRPQHVVLRQRSAASATQPVGNCHALAAVSPRSAR